MPSYSDDISCQSRTEILRKRKKVWFGHFNLEISSKTSFSSRFFCPPPCVYLSGDGWKGNSTESCCSSSSFAQSDHIFGTIGLGEPLAVENENCLSNEIQNLSFEHGNTKYSSAKTLFISDSDKRKYINLNVRLMYKNDMGSNGFLGLFESGKMKVISKPSKKKQSVKNAECITKRILLSWILIFFFHNSMHPVRNKNRSIQSSSVEEISYEENIFVSLEVRMSVRDFYMSMKTINFMPVHKNGDHFIFI